MRDNLSPFDFTYEPSGLSEVSTRILIDQKNTRSASVTEIDGVISSVGSTAQLELKTLVLLGSDDLSKRNESPAILIALNFADAIKLEKPIGIKTIEVVMGNERIVGFESRVQANSFGLWDWTYTFRNVPLGVEGVEVTGSMDISGRSVEVPHSLVRTTLEKYWLGWSELSQLWEESE